MRRQRDPPRGEKIYWQKGGNDVGYKVCPYCGANLDPDEKCDCQDTIATSQHENEPAGASRTGSDDQS